MSNNNNNDNVSYVDPLHELHRKETVAFRMQKYHVWKAYERGRTRSPLFRLGEKHANLKAPRCATSLSPSKTRQPSSPPRTLPPRRKARPPKQQQRANTLSPVKTRLVQSRYMSPPSPPRRDPTPKKVRPAPPPRRPTPATTTPTKRPATKRPVSKPIQKKSTPSKPNGRNEPPTNKKKTAPPPPPAVDPLLLEKDEKPEEEEPDFNLSAVLDTALNGSSHHQVVPSPQKDALVDTSSFREEPMEEGEEKSVEEQPQEEQEIVFEEGEEEEDEDEDSEEEDEEAEEEVEEVAEEEEVEQVEEQEQAAEEEQMEEEEEEEQAVQAEEEEEQVEEVVEKHVDEEQEEQPEEEEEEEEEVVQEEPQADDDDSDDDDYLDDDLPEPEPSLEKIIVPPKENALIVFDAMDAPSLTLVELEAALVTLLPESFTAETTHSMVILATRAISKGKRQDYEEEEVSRNDFGLWLRYIKFFHNFFNVFENNSTRRQIDAEEFGQLSFLMDLQPSDFENIDIKQKGFVTYGKLCLWLARNIRDENDWDTIEQEVEEEEEYDDVQHQQYADDDEDDDDLHQHYYQENANISKEEEEEDDVDVEEETATSTLSVPTSEQQILEMFDNLDTRQMGAITLPSLEIRIVEKYPEYAGTAIALAFEATDQNGNGFITRADFGFFLKFIQFYHTLRDHLSIMDDDKVTYEAFVEAPLNLGGKRADQVFDMIDTKMEGIVPYKDVCQWMARNL